MMDLKIIQCFSQFIDSGKILLIRIIFSACTSKILSDDGIKSSITYDNSLAPSLNHIGFRTRIKFDDHCLEQIKFTFHRKTVLNIYIVYEILLPLK